MIKATAPCHERARSRGKPRGITETRGSRRRDQPPTKLAGQGLIPVTVAAPGFEPGNAKPADLQRAAPHAFDHTIRPPKACRGERLGESRPITHPARGYRCRRERQSDRLPRFTGVVHPLEPPTAPLPDLCGDDRHCSPAFATPRTILPLRPHGHQPPYRVAPLAYPKLSGADPSTTKLCSGWLLNVAAVHCPAATMMDSLSQMSPNT